MIYWWSMAIANTALVNKFNATNIIQFEGKWTKCSDEEKIVWLDNGFPLQSIEITNNEIANNVSLQTEILKLSYYHNGTVIQIPQKFICPITKNIMYDPVIAFDGYNYERRAIESDSFLNASFTPNNELRKEILEYIQERNIEIDKIRRKCRLIYWLDLIMMIANGFFAICMFYMWAMVIYAICISYVIRPNECRAQNRLIW